MPVCVPSRSEDTIASPARRGSTATPGSPGHVSIPCRIGRVMSITPMDHIIPCRAPPPSLGGSPRTAPPIPFMEVEPTAETSGASRIELLTEVPIAANRAGSIDEAMQIALDQICRYAGWPIGHVYVADGDTLLPSAIWHLSDPERFATFRSVTEGTPLASGTGLPGRVHASRRPAWIADVTRDENFPRAKAAEDIGVRAAFAFPVVADGEAVAVLELFAPEAIEPDRALLETVAHVGDQLARLVERTRAAEALRANEDRTRRVIETASDAFVALDAKGSITDWNRQAEIAFGWSKEEAIGRALADTIIPVRFRDAHLRGLRRFLETGEGPVLGKRVELAALRRDGTEFPVELTVWALDVRGQPTFNAFIHDITERKHAEQTLRDSEQRFAEAYAREREAKERLEALDAMKNGFLTAVSHELRTPLAAVVGFAQTLHMRGADLDPHERERFVERIASNADKLERLLADLLDLDRLTRGIIEPRRRPTEVGAVVRRVADEMFGDGDRPVRIDIPPITAEVDPAQLDRIVENLLVNALKHTEPGTPIWVWAAEQDVGVVLAIEDAGPGVPDDLKVAIFDPFTRGPETPAHAPGTGIGLSLVARFAALHGGRAWVEDRPGGGASFRVYLPSA